jgi:hypothetical protein
MTQEEIEKAANGLMKLFGGRHPASFASEDKLQEYCFKWWNKNFRGISMLHSVPNGANISDMERQKMIGTGLVAGAADLELKWKPRMIAHIEMKNGPQDIRPNQKVFKARIEALGHLYYKATNFFEFVVVVCKCLNLQPDMYL